MMGATHFLMKRLRNVKTETILHVLTYNLKRAMQIIGVVPLMNNDQGMRFPSFFPRPQPHLGQEPPMGGRGIAAIWVTVAP
jgi:hypothetical protein